MLTRMVIYPASASSSAFFFHVRNVEIVSNELVLPAGVQIGSVVQIGVPGEARHFF
jgi:hypothetical protein